jgi:hypothetical protein
MKPRFPPDEIETIAERYWNYQSPAQRQREQDIIDTLAPAFCQGGYLNLDELVVLAAW